MRPRRVVGLLLVDLVLVACSGGHGSEAPAAMPAQTSVPVATVAPSAAPAPPPAEDDEDQFVGAYPFCAPIAPRRDGGMLYGFLTTPKAHPLCRTPEPRVLPDDLADFAGTWARLR